MMPQRAFHSQGRPGVKQDTAQGNKRLKRGDIFAQVCKEHLSTAGWEDFTSVSGRANICLLTMRSSLQYFMAGGSSTPADLKEVREKMGLARSNVLRVNFGFIPESGFRQRKQYFNARVRLFDPSSIRFSSYHAYWIVIQGSCDHRATDLALPGF